MDGTSPMWINPKGAGGTLVLTEVSGWHNRAQAGRLRHHANIVDKKISTLNLEQ